MIPYNALQVDNSIMNHLENERRCLTDFAGDLYSRFCDAYGWEQNCILCPLSLHSNLSLMLPATEGIMSTEIRNVLGLRQESSDSQILESVEKFLSPILQDITQTDFLLLSTRIRWRKSYLKSVRSRIEVSSHFKRPKSSSEPQ